MCNSPSQLPLVFIIGIARNANQLDAVRISESSIEITAVFFDLLLTGGGFFYCKFAAGHLADLFPIQARVMIPSRVRWCRSSTSF